MTDIYESCPAFESGKYIIRLISLDDTEDLHKIYSDKNALPFFNSDNCHGINFYNPTVEAMLNTVKSWIQSYENREFVRFSIVDKSLAKVIGTIELFHRISEDSFNNTGMLRIDVGSEFETVRTLLDILKIIIEPSYRLFECETIVTKAPVYAVDRIEALREYGFEKSEDFLIGHLDNYPHRDYWTVSKNG